MRDHGPGTAALRAFAMICSAARQGLCAQASENRADAATGFFDQLVLPAVGSAQKFMQGGLGPGAFRLILSASPKPSAMR